MYQKDFTIGEFTERRSRIRDGIGAEAVALIQGGEKESGHDLFRQTNDFYYLCGVEVPHAYLLIDGRNGQSSLFLSHQSARQKAQEGEVLSPENGEEVLRLTGVDAVYGIEALAGSLERASTIYTPMHQAEGTAMSWDTLQRSQHDIFSDPWDGRPNRMRAFVSLLRERCPAARVADLCPVLNELRFIKSEQERDLLRIAGDLSALGVVEAMRSNKPGVMEYQLDAVMRYVYLVNGSRDYGYRAIIAGGENAQFGHYKANNSVLNDGEWVLVDCAPDYHYYTSDIGRMWPVNGRYTDVQRELYGFMVEYHKTFLRLLRPGVTAEQITAEASSEMKKVADSTKWSKPAYEKGARWALDFPYQMSHPVGMAVHDVGHYRGKVIRPGTVLTLDPQMVIPEEHLYVRVEDTLIMTEDGYENFTARAPLELDEVEALMKEPGMLQQWEALS